MTSAPKRVPPTQSPFGSYEDPGGGDVASPTASSAQAERDYEYYARPDSQLPQGSPVRRRRPGGQSDPGGPEAQSGLGAQRGAI
jgi:hypothetical protein